MKFKTFLLLLFMMLVLGPRGFPQEQVITGVVTDSLSSELLPGVNVVVEGTTTGTSTNTEGRFSLPKPLNGSVLLFSFIGYNTVEVLYTGQSEINVQLAQMIRELDQVVVIGYGTIKKSDLTGSIAQVTSKEIEKVSPVNIGSALQGRAAGLMVNAVSGAPASEPVIRVRGIGTLNNNDPIYVVDGMIIELNPWDAANISYLNPMDIESIEILKDASAQAIYGSRAANGVILVTTRKGSEGAPKVNFTSTLSINNVRSVPEVLDREQFMDYIKTCYTNGYKRTYELDTAEVTLDKLVNEYTTVRDAVAEYNTGTYTNWYKEVLRKNVLSQNYNLQLSGGAKNAHYLASAGYLFNDGIIRNYSYKRTSFRLNTDFNVGKHITVGENLGITSSNRLGNSNYAGAFYSAMFADPLSPVYRPDREIDKTDANYQYNRYKLSPITGSNPASEVELANERNTMLTVAGNFFGELSFLKYLKFRSSYGFNRVYSNYKSYSPFYSLGAGSGRDISELWAEAYHTNGWVWENTLTLSKVSENHSINVLIGYTSQYTLAETEDAFKLGTPSNAPQMQTFDAAIIQPRVFGSYTTVAMASYLARVNYTYRNRYLLTATVRRDGSSKFGPDYRWGTFPSFSLGWKVSEERFIKSSRNKFISSLKIRAGWGRIGNSSLPSNYTFAYLSQLSPWNQGTFNPGNWYIFNENARAGYFLSQIGTPDITWETTEQMNFGFDISILKNSLALTADYYIKDTKGMLLQVPVPDYTGYGGGFPYTNAGSVRNRGFELVLDYRGKTGSFTYGATINFTSFINKVTSLGRGNKPIISWFNRTEVGKSIGNFYGMKTDGIFQTEQEVADYRGSEDSILQKSAHAGDFRFKNLNGDNALDQADETWIGNPWPDFTFGLNFNLGYKAFDLLLFFQGSYGNDIYMQGLEGHLWNQGTGNELEYIYKNSWRGEGTSNSQPLLTSLDQNSNYRASDYLIGDGSYLRLKYVQIGYNLPQTACEKLKITNGRLWIGGTNMLTLTGYRGTDPEIGTGASAISTGIDGGSLFPQTREITVGISVSF